MHVALSQKMPNIWNQLHPADPRRFMAQLESLSFCDYSMAIKAGVHFTLCGGTICKLGTAKHHEALLPRLNTLDLPGCFGMTELGHGSNVMGIETTVRVWGVRMREICRLSALVAQRCCDDVFMWLFCATPGPWQQLDGHRDNGMYHS
jgi:hypothetical protein